MKPESSENTQSKITKLTCAKFSELCERMIKTLFFFFNLLIRTLLERIPGDEHVYLSGSALKTFLNQRD